MHILHGTKPEPEPHKCFFFRFLWQNIDDDELLRSVDFSEFERDFKLPSAAPGSSTNDIRQRIFSRSASTDKVVFVDVNRAKNMSKTWVWFCPTVRCTRESFMFRKKPTISRVSYLVCSATLNSSEYTLCKGLIDSWVDR